MRVRAAELIPGHEFCTLLTKRPGTVLANGRRGIEVVLGGERIGKVIWLHPDVLVEVER